MSELDREAWNNICFSVKRAMTPTISPYVTPVSRIIEHDYGRLEGTGSYIEIQNTRYLLTNEHVGRARQTNPIAHQFHGSHDVFRLLTVMPYEPYPIDVAIAPIPDGIWNTCTHQAIPIPYSRLATTHNPVRRELLFTVGYTQQRSRFTFGHLMNYATPYLTQETDLPPHGTDPQYHFAVPYRPDQAQMDEPDEQTQPNPPGLSGSLVWNTRYFECERAGLPWSPAAAQVTGLVWGWRETCLIATRVEHLGLIALSNISREFQVTPPPATLPSVS